MQKISVLFICTGNICRSPTAEGVFRRIIEQEGFSEHITIDSAGIGSWHSGSQPDERSQAAAKSRGFDLSRLRARKLTPTDLEKFDYLIAMDRSHLKTISDSAKKEKCRLLLEFSEKYFNQDVTDPYYGGPHGFEHVLDLIEDGTSGFFFYLKKKFF